MNSSSAIKVLVIYVDELQVELLHEDTDSGRLGASHIDHLYRRRHRTRQYIGCRVGCRLEYRLDKLGIAGLKVRV
jgi:hypothetical protein